MCYKPHPKLTICNSPNYFAVLFICLRQPKTYFSHIHEIQHKHIRQYETKTAVLLFNPDRELKKNET